VITVRIGFNEAVTYLAIDMASERLHDGKRMPGEIRQLVKRAAAAAEEVWRVRTVAIVGMLT
jgi:hypothetical protein